MGYLKKIVMGLLPLEMDYILKRMKYRSLSHRKYRGYRPAGGYRLGHKMQKYIDYVEKGTNITVKNVFEIGANFAQDADYMKEYFCLNNSDIYVFEAYPEICDVIKKIHKFNAYNNAVYNEEKQIEFNTTSLNYRETGCSSIFFEPEGIKVKVEAIRMDSFMEKNNIDEIDFLKIDVEGASYHVLEGFGNKLSKVKCIQVEAEHDNWAIVPYEKISELLMANGFELIYFERSIREGMKQSDSFWVKKEYLYKT